MNKPTKVTFAEGCFDDFEGTQEELDDLVASIINAAECGAFEDLGEFVEIDEFLELNLREVLEDVGDVDLDEPLTNEEMPSTTRH